MSNVSILQGQDSEWVFSHLILLDFGAIGSCVENFVVFKLWQSLKAEYHDGEEDDSQPHTLKAPAIAGAFYFFNQFNISL